MNEDEFIEFIVSRDLVEFGDFIVKSGKYADNMIHFRRIALGSDLMKLGEFYADFIVEKGLHKNLDVVFGPAYGAIGLAIATSAMLAQKHNLSVGFAFNRKTPKTHGERSALLGRDVSRSNVLIVDDVMTDGGTKYETAEMLTRCGANVKGMVIGVDKQYKDGGKPYIDILREKTNLPVYAMTTLDKILARIRK